MVFEAPAATAAAVQPAAQLSRASGDAHPSPGLLHCAGHYPTYESAVHGFASARELSALRKKAAAAPGGRVELKVPGPKPKRQAGPVYDPRVGAWALPFMGEGPTGGQDYGWQAREGRASRASWLGCVCRAEVVVVVVGGAWQRRALLAGRSGSCTALGA